MADEVDQAQEKMELGLADAIRAARMAGPVILATGYCLWCDEILSDGARWCGTAHRDSWQKETGVK